jgi:NADH:ubiquinone oxidoreductase subunit 5 (subunit L)/multisubunit Na+/H+ antiporter MnhA subunit
LFGVLAATTALTALYMFRSYFLVFWARPPRTEPAGATHEPSRRMTAVVLTLAFGSILVGPILGWPRNWNPAHRAPLLERMLAGVFSSTEGLVQSSRPSGGVELSVQTMGLVLATLGFAFARSLYRDAARTARWRGGMSLRLARLFAWIAGGWGFDGLYRELVVLPARDFARATIWLDRRVFDPAVNGVTRLGVRLARIARDVDRRVVDGAVDGIANFVLASGGPVSRLQSGRIGSYVLGIAAGIAVFAVLAYVLGS